MKHRLLVFLACTVPLGGCDVVRALLPRRATTVADARAALIDCGIVPDRIAWSVQPDGSFAFGRKRVEALPITATGHACLMRWVETDRIKLAFIGWETGPR